MAEHSPTPWHTLPCGEPDCWCLCIVTDTGLGRDDREGCVVPAGCLSAADAEFVVRAVNHHDALLAACRAARLHLGLPYPEEEPIERARVLADLETAIAGAAG